MYLAKYVAAVLVTCGCFITIEGVVRTTLERSTLTVFDDSVIKNYNTSVRRPNRTSRYMMYLYFDMVKPFNDKILLDITTFEFRSNVYKESIIKAKLNFCSVLEKDQWLLPVLRSYSNIPKKCPYKGSFIMTDGYIPDNVIPNAFPQGRWRFDLKVKIDKALNFFANLQLYFKIEHTNGNGKSKKSGKKKSLTSN